MITLVVSVWTVQAALAIILLWVLRIRTGANLEDALNENPQDPYKVALAHARQRARTVQLIYFGVHFALGLGQWFIDVEARRLITIAGLILADSVVLGGLVIADVIYTRQFDRIGTGRHWWR